MHSIWFASIHVKQNITKFYERFKQNRVRTSYYTKSLFEPYKPLGYKSYYETIIGKCIENLLMCLLSFFEVFTKLLVFFHLL